MRDPIKSKLIKLRVAVTGHYQANGSGSAALAVDDDQFECAESRTHNFNTP